MTDDGKPVETTEDMAMRKSLVAQQGPTFSKNGTHAAYAERCARCVGGEHQHCESRSCACACRRREV